MAAPGGLTGLVLDHGVGSIHAPNVISSAHIAPAHVVHQPIAPIVHSWPIVTRTVLPAHHGVVSHGLVGHGWNGHGWNGHGLVGLHG